jgi:26S proteasome regulatory subunit N13
MGAQQAEGKLYPLLSDLLETSLTIPMIDSASVEQVDMLLGFLPPAIIILAQQPTHSGDTITEPDEAMLAAARAAMSQDQKKTLLKRVLRSPQFHQSLVSLTVALRDGGLPTVAGALGIEVANNGLVRGGAVPLGGGDAVEAFVEGVKNAVRKDTNDGVSDS